MIEFVTSPKGIIAAAIFDQVKEMLGVAAAGTWMFSPNIWLDGHTPIMAIREGKQEQVNNALEKLKENKGVKPLRCG